MTTLDNVIPQNNKTINRLIPEESKWLEHGVIKVLPLNIERKPGVEYPGEIRRRPAFGSINLITRNLNSKKLIPPTLV